jgi:hypothetical protein
MQQKWDLISYYEFNVYMTYKPSKLSSSILMKIVPFRLLSSRHERCPHHGHVFRLDLAPNSKIYLIGTGSFMTIVKRQDGYFVSGLQPIDRLRAIGEHINVPIGFRDPSIIQPIN